MTDQRADQLARAAIAGGEPTAWFERLYAGALYGPALIPWDRDAPHPLLVDWMRSRDGLSGRRAVVAGCGLGTDAEYLAAQGLSTTAFDISESAIRIARDRHPRSPVQYRAANALDLPADWRRSFDLVVEIYTVQSIPDPPRSGVVAAIAGLTAPGGTLLVIAAARDDDQPPADGPPWPLLGSEVTAFAAGDLQLTRLERIDPPDDWSCWRAEFSRAMLAR
jgi:SAM-dependent methyltransferase